MAFQFLAWVLNVYAFLIFVWVLGSWFPQWKYTAWYRLVNDLVEPYIRLFRPLRLQAGMIDFTPMAAIFVLILVRTLLISMAGGFYG